MSSRIVFEVEDFEDILQTLEMSMQKHQDHDQSSHGSWAGGGQITSEQKQAVQAYTQTIKNNSQWRDVAQSIRDGKTPNATPEFVSSVKNLLNALDEHSVTPTNGNGKVLLRSGINWKGKLPAVGDVMSNPFSSATWRSNVAEKFAQSGDGKPVIVKYGSSTKGLDVSKFGADFFGGEGEFIVSGKFEVVGRDKENGFNYVSVRQVADVVKHQDHDQRSHGSWAHGGGDNALNNFEKKVNEAYGTGEEAFSIYNTGDESVAALGEYLGRGHILNGNIRSSGDDDRGDGKTYNEGSVVKGIDNAIELAPRIPNQTVYRIASKEVIESLTKNSIYTDKGFTSTTAVDITAPGNGKLLMTLNFVSPGKKTIMKIDTGSVGKGLYMPKIFPGQPIAEFEREFLMPRNTKMKYLGPDYMFTPNEQILTIHKFKVVE